MAKLVFVPIEPLLSGCMGSVDHLRRRMYKLLCLMVGTAISVVLIPLACSGNLKVCQGFAGVLAVTSPITASELHMRQWTRGRAGSIQVGASHGHDMHVKSSAVVAADLVSRSSASSTSSGSSVDVVHERYFPTKSSATNPDSFTRPFEQLLRPVLSDLLKSGVLEAIEAQRRKRMILDDQIALETQRRKRAVLEEQWQRVEVETEVRPDVEFYMARPRRIRRAGEEVTKAHAKAAKTSRRVRQLSQQLAEIDAEEARLVDLLVKLEQPRADILLLKDEVDAYSALPARDTSMNAWGRPSGFDDLVIRSPHGVPILVAHKASNDALLHQIAHGTDLLFQARNKKGLRVLLRTSMVPSLARSPRECMEMAADFAAHFSEVRYSSDEVDVIFTDSQHATKRGSRVRQLKDDQRLGTIRARPWRVAELAHEAQEEQGYLPEGTKPRTRARLHDEKARAKSRNVRSFFKMFPAVAHWDVSAEAAQKRL